MTFCLLFCFIIESFICRKVGFQLRMLNVIFKDLDLGLNCEGSMVYVPDGFI